MQEYARMEVADDIDAATGTSSGYFAARLAASQTHLQGQKATLSVGPALIKVILAANCLAATTALTALAARALLRRWQYRHKIDNEPTKLVGAARVMQFVLWSAQECCHIAPSEAKSGDGNGRTTGFADCRMDMALQGDFLVDDMLANLSLHDKGVLLSQETQLGKDNGNGMLTTGLSQTRHSKRLGLSAEELGDYWQQPLLAGCCGASTAFESSAVLFSVGSYVITLMVLLTCCSAMAAIFTYEQGWQQAAWCVLLLGMALLLVSALWTRRPLIPQMLGKNLFWVEERTGMVTSRSRLAATALIEITYVVLTFGVGALVSIILHCSSGKSSVSERLTGITLASLQRQRSHSKQKR